MHTREDVQATLHRAGRAARFNAEVGNLAHRVGQHVGCVHVRHPAIAVFGDPLHCHILAARNPDRHTWLLDRAGRDRDVVQGGEPTIEAHVLLGEQQVDHLECFVGASTPLLDRHTDRFELTWIFTTHTDSQREPPTGDNVEHGDLFGQQRWRVERHQHDAAEQLDPFGRPGGCCKRHDVVRRRHVKADVLAGRQVVKTQVLGHAGLGLGIV